MISFLFKKKGSMQSSLLLPCLLSGCSCCGVPIGRIIAFPGHVIHTIFHTVYNIFSCLSDTVYHVVYNCATLCGCSACCVIVICGFIAVCSIFGIQYIVVRIGCCRTVCCRTICTSAVSVIFCVSVGSLICGSIVIVFHTIYTCSQTA